MASAETLIGHAKAVDGDTLAIGRERIRLRNYNAPELDRPGGVDARRRLADLVAGRSVICETVARDRYARAVALCRVDGVDLGLAMRAGP